MNAARVIQISSYYPPHLGGQENAAHDLAEQLALAGHDTHVLTSTVGGGPQGITAEQGVHVNRLWGFVFGHAPIMPAFPLALFRLARSNSVVHVHIGQAFTPEMVWLVAKLRRFKYIAELHIDFQASGPAGVLLPLYKRFVLGRVLRSAAAVIVLNQQTLQTVREVYGHTGRAGIMSNGIDETYFRLKRPEFAAEPPPTLRLLFVGRLSKQKNIGALLQALTLTKRQVHVDLIGDGDEHELVLQMIAKHRLANVTMHGRLARDKVMQFYKTCDALIMPSLYEAQPLVLLEAMAARIPIICTNVIGVADHVGGAGIVVEPTPEGIAAGIEQYYEHYDMLPSMVRHAHSLAAKFRWVNNLKKYEALYNEVARA